VRGVVVVVVAVVTVMWLSLADARSQAIEANSLPADHPRPNNRGRSRGQSVSAWFGRGKSEAQRKSETSNEIAKKESSGDTGGSLATGLFSLFSRKSNLNEVRLPVLVAELRR
jgi:hypothetical protein